MEYCVLDIKWGADRSGKKVIYYIADMTAILLDETIHTIDKFIYVNKNEYTYSNILASKNGGSKVTIDDEDNGWQSFRQWLPENACLVVWGMSMVLPISYHEAKIKKKGQLSNAIIDLEKIYTAMTNDVMRERSVTMGSAANELKLTYDKNKAVHSEYETKVLVRLFRKILAEGIEGSGEVFIKYMVRNKMSKIRNHTYFENIRQTYLKKEKDTVISMVEECGYEGEYLNNMLNVDTGYAIWKIPLDHECSVIEYRTRKLYKGTRKRYLMWERGTTIYDKVVKSLDMISMVEQKARYGVGNEQITELVDAVANQVYN